MFKIILLVVVAIPVVIVGALLLAGLRANRGVNRAEIVIHAPAPAVWRHLEEPSLVKGWVSGLVEIEPLTPGFTEPAVGMRDRMIVEVNGQRNELFSEITAVEKGRHLAQVVRAEKGLPFTEVMSFTLHEDDGGGTGSKRTRFVIDATWQYSTLLGRMLEPIIARVAQKKLDDDLARLKANVERAS